MIRAVPGEVDVAVRSDILDDCIGFGRLRIGLVGDQDPAAVRPEDGVVPVGVDQRGRRLVASSDRPELVVEFDQPVPRLTVDAGGRDTV